MNAVCVCGDWGFLKKSNRHSQSIEPPLRFLEESNEQSPTQQPSLANDRMRPAQPSNLSNAPSPANERMLTAHQTSHTPEQKLCPERKNDGHV